MPDNRIRRVQPSDVDRVVELIHELADYEKSLDECHITAERLHTSLFRESPALFGHVAETGGEVVGTALWFLNYSTWHGTHGIFLEDLYVRPALRGSGLGTALLAELAAECVRNGYTRLQWSVLKWNTPSIGFYRSLGAEPMDEWDTYRLTGDPLTALGTGRAGTGDSQVPLG